jgi:dipeptidyl aminopeptidase/acylaminoacyl peptidase
VLGRTRIFVVALTLLGPVLVAGSPAGSADRDRSEERAQGKRHSHPAGGMPARFVAESGGRIVVVAAATGQIEKYLTGDQPGGGAADPAVSPDGRSVWFSRTDGDCAAHLASVPVGGGKERPVPGSGEAGPEERPLPRPGYAQLAFTRTDCDEPAESLFVTDIQGLEGYGQTGLLPVAWSRSGQHLLAHSSDGREVRLLTVNNAGSIVDNTVLAPRDRSKDCRLEVAGFSPDDNGGYVALRRCEGADQDARRSLVLLNRAGEQRKVLVRLRRGHDFVDRIAFDPTGRSLLFSTAPSARRGDARRSAPEVSLWVWRDGTVKRVIRDSPYRHPAWLP